MHHPVQLAFTKWDGSQHWTEELRWLGADQYGTWLAAAAGAVIRKPGAQVISKDDRVALVPHRGGFVATFHLPGAWVALYIDMATQPLWHGDRVTAVDFDLDVVRRWDGSIEVLDEDEFAEHQVRYNYPPEIIELAERSRDDIVAALRKGAEPFDSVGATWLAQVRSTLD